MENVKTAEVYKQMVKWQVLATLAVVASILVIAGVHAAVSAFAGGFSVVIGGIAGALVAKSGDKKQQAGAILIAMLKGEAVKIFVIALLLFITFKVYSDLVPMALIIGLAASAILSGAAFFGLDKK
jgi:ATP synthase protein I